MRVGPLHLRPWTLCHENKLLYAVQATCSVSAAFGTFTRSSPGAPRLNEQLLAPAAKAYYLLIDPVRMKG